MSAASKFGDQAGPGLAAPERVSPRGVPSRGGAEPDDRMRPDETGTESLSKYRLSLGWARDCAGRGRGLSGSSRARDRLRPLRPWTSGKRLPGFVCGRRWESEQHFTRSDAWHSALVTRWSGARHDRTTLHFKSRRSTLSDPASSEQGAQGSLQGLCFHGCLMRLRLDTLAPGSNELVNVDVPNHWLSISR